MNKAFLVIFTLCLILFLSGCVNQQDNNTSTEIKNTYTNLTINSPHQGEIVKGKISVNGTTRPLQSNEKLYVIVKPAGYGWWIQNAPIIETNGKWSCITQIGENRDSGREFTICAVISRENLTYASQINNKFPEYKMKDELSVYRV